MIEFAFALIREDFRLRRRIHGIVHGHGHCRVHGVRRIVFSKKRRWPRWEKGSDRESNNRDVKGMPEKASHAYLLRLRCAVPPRNSNADSYNEFDSAARCWVTICLRRGVSPK